MSEYDSLKAGKDLSGVTAERVGEAPDSVSGLAGRELDAVVHRDVMGAVWDETLGAVWDETRCRICGWTLATSSDEGCVVGNCSERPSPTREIRADVPPRYSTDMATAMKVVEKMRERGFRFEALSPRGTGWQVRCFPADDAPDGYQKFKGILPLALCRAALAALNTQDTNSAEGGHTGGCNAGT